MTVQSSGENAGFGVQGSGFGMPYTLNPRISEPEATPAAKPV